MQYKVKYGMLVILGFISFSGIGFANQDKSYDLSKKLDFQYCEAADLNPTYMINRFEEDREESEQIGLPKGYQIFKDQFLNTFERRIVDLTCSRYLNSFQPYQEVEFSCMRTNVLTEDEMVRVRVYRNNFGKRLAVLAFGPYESQNVDNILPMFCE